MIIGSMTLTLTSQAWPGMANNLLKVTEHNGSKAYMLNSLDSYFRPVPCC